MRLFNTFNRCVSRADVAVVVFLPEIHIQMCLDKFLVAVKKISKTVLCIEICHFEINKLF